MNYLKRTQVSLKRSKWKVLTLFVLVFILGNLISGAVSIQRAVELTERNLRALVPPIVTIQRQFEAQLAYEENYLAHLSREERRAHNDSLVLTPEIVSQLSKLNAVVETEIYVFSSMDSFDLERVADHPFLEAPFHDYSLAQFHIKGVNRPQFGDLNMGLVEILYGRTFTDEELLETGLRQVAIVSQAFAEANGLMVGSQFTLENNLYDFSQVDDQFTGRNPGNILQQEIYEFEIIGIFGLINELTTGDEWFDDVLSNELYNQVYVPMEVAIAANRFQIESLVQQFGSDWNWLRDEFEANSVHIGNNPTFLLRDPLEIDSFREEALAILPNFWEVVDLSAAYGDIAVAMSNMNWIATLIRLISIGACIIILTLLVLLALNDRKHEIGIYMALGEKKSKIISQFWLEILLVSMAALLVSLFTGNVLASNLSEHMLREQVVAQQEERAYRRFVEGRGHASGEDRLSFFSPGYFDVDEMMAEYHLGMDGDVIITFLLTGFSILTLSSAIPLIYLTSINPKKVLMSH